MSLVVRVEDGQRKVEVRAAQEAAGMAALRFAAAFLGLKTRPTEAHEPPKPTPETTQKTLAPVQAEQQAVEEKPQPTSKSRALPLINSERTLSVPISELVQNKGMEPDKVTEDGVELYRARYSCPRCGSSGVRFQPLHNVYLKCRNCSAKLKLVRAAADGRDEEGNFFVATELYLEEVKQDG